MLLDSFFRTLDSPGPPMRVRRSRRAAHARPASSRLLLERLEQRVLPSFLAPRAFDAGNLPQSVATGDLTCHNVLDLAVANYSSNYVSLLLGICEHLRHLRASVLWTRLAKS